MKAADIQIRDPYVYAHPQEKIYYMFGTTDHNCWRGPGQGFDCYYSKDLREWEGPIPAFKPSGHFWGKENFWAPEVHKFNGRFYMFASFKAEKRYRATQILTAQDVAGPYLPLVDEPVTPPDWQCLDGTLLMLWSSLGTKGYAMDASRSENGQISGPWQHDPDPIWAEDGGHGMIFKTFAGQLMLTFHSPNQSPNERAAFVEIEEKDGGIQLKS